MEDIVLARALHVLAVVIWIGGVSMVTTVMFPALRRGELGPDRLRAFHAFEGRFVWQARATVLLVGASGLFMTWRLDLWDRFYHGGASFWWMHMMVCVWALFAFILFVGEPLILHRRFEAWASADPQTAFARLHALHWVLLVLSLVTIFGAAAGSQGWSMF